MNVDFVFELIRKRWKQCLLIVFLASAVTATILMMQKPVYKSTAIFTAANPNLGDRSNIYRTQFWEQYFYYGSEFDNDRLMAIARSEEMCRFMVDTFQLVRHYKINPQGAKALFYADKEFKESVKIHKNEFGHVKVIVWDTDKQLAAAIANRIMQRVNEQSIASSNKMKAEIIQKLKHDYSNQRDTLAMLETGDSGEAGLLRTARKNEIISQLNEKERLIQQFETSLNDVGALFVIEQALPALNKDKPKILSGIVMAAVISFIFSVLLLLLLEWKAKRKAN
jgi:capsular polysaccharide biosynthesis protein